MKRRCCLLLVLFYFVATANLSAQDLRLPRDPEKLIDRVQQLWGHLASGRRFQALEFVLPENKELFVSGNPIPIVNAQVIGVDLTNDPHRATVRIQIRVLATSSSTSEPSWTITDQWVWKDDNWYLTVQAPPDIFRRSDRSNSELDVSATQKQLEQFILLRDSIDAGTLVDGVLQRIEVPVRYTGDLPVTVELAIENSLVALEFESSVGMDRNSGHFTVLVNTEASAGPFNIQLPLKIRYQTVTINRTLFLKGNIFVPIAFRQSPPNGPIETGREFSVFIRNNTKEQVAARLISVDGKFDILKRPEKLPPNQETEMVLKLRPGQIPDRLYLELDTPLHGRSVYTYQFRNRSR